MSQVLAEVHPLAERIGEAEGERTEGAEGAEIGAGLIDTTDLGPKKAGEDRIALPAFERYPEAGESQAGKLAPREEEPGVERRDEFPGEVRVPITPQPEAAAAARPVRFDFYQAVKLMKSGNKIARAAWKKGEGTPVYIYCVAGIGNVPSFCAWHRGAGWSLWKPEWADILAQDFEIFWD